MPVCLRITFGRGGRLRLYRTLFSLERLPRMGFESFLESLQSSVVQVVSGLEREAAVRELQVWLKWCHLDFRRI